MYDEGGIILLMLIFITLALMTYYLHLIFVEINTLRRLVNGAIIKLIDKAEKEE
jgi:hypothetical protein